MECVAILIEEKTDWDNIKKNVLGDAGLLTKLKNLRGENITPATKEKIKKRLNGNPLFVPAEMKSINVAAKSICEWIHAVNNYTDVYREIQ
jgi:dynein heavy chain